MARSHARVKVEAWEPGGEFRALTLPAQWAYVMLISQPEINNCGVLPYRPERWVEFADGLSRRALNAALRELRDRRFVIVDERTRELLVRTFIKHDRIEAQPNLEKSAKRQYREIESPAIREVLADLYPGLFAALNVTATGRNSSANGTAGGTNTAAFHTASGQNSDENEPPPVETDTGSNTPNGREPAWLSEADPEPLSEGVSEPLNARARTAPAADPIPLNPSELQDSARDPADEQPGDSAAAAAQPAGELAILNAARRFGADLAVVSPIAEQVSEHTLAAVVEKVERKIRRGGVEDVPALFVHVLQRAPKLAAAEPAPAVVLTPEQIAEADARQYARQRVPWDVAADLIARRLRKEGLDDTLRAAVLERCHATYDDVATEPAAGR